MKMGRIGLITLLRMLGDGSRLLRPRVHHTLVAALMLALGLASTALVLAIALAALLRPLPLPGSEDLALLWETHPEQAEESRLVAPGNAEDWRELDCFEGLALITLWRPLLETEEGGRRLSAARVSAELLQVLNAQPALGRNLQPADLAPDAGSVVMVSHRFWQVQLGASREAIGRDLQLDGKSFTVVGVLPAKLRLRPPLVVESPEVLGLLNSGPGRASRGRRVARAVARLSQGTRFEIAHEQLQANAQALATTYPRTNQGWSARLSPLHSELARPLRPSLLGLLAAVVTLLLTTCVHAGHLLLARVLERQQEWAIRLALGATTRRLAAPVLASGLSLGAAGILLALPLIWLGMHNLPLLGSGLETLTPDQSAKTYLWLLALWLPVSALLSAPALSTMLRWPLASSSMETRLSSFLGQGSRATAGRGQVRWRKLLISGGVGLAFLLLAVAGTLLHDLRKLSQEHSDLELHELSTLRVELPRKPATESGSRTATSTSRRYLALLDRLQASPRVTAATVAHQIPLGPQHLSVEARLADHPERQPLRVALRAVGPDYVRTLGMPLLGGRDLQEQDMVDRGGTRPILVSSKAARLLWPGAEALGRELNLSWGETRRRSVVGVVADADRSKRPGTSSNELPTVYLPIPDLPQRSAYLLLRLRDAATTARDLRALLLAGEPTLLVESSQPLDQLLARQWAGLRHGARLLTLLGLLAFGLALVAVHSAVSQLVVLRREEIRVRLALGATPRSILRLTWIACLRLLLPGLAWGGLGSLLWTRLATAIPGLGHRGIPELWIPALCALLMLVAGLIAAYLPARRAASLEPAAMMRRC